MIREASQNSIPDNNMAKKEKVEKNKTEGKF